MHYRILYKLTGISLAAVSLALVVACEAPVEDKVPVGAGSEAVESPAGLGAESPDVAPGPEHARHHGKHMRGPVALLRGALGELELSESQRGEIDKLLAGIEPPQRDDEAHRAFRKTLADSVRAGVIDDAVIASQSAAAKEHMAARRAAMAQTVQKVHDLLNSEQRAALATSLRKRIAEMGQHFGHGPKGERGKRGMHGMRGEHGMHGMHGMRGGQGHFRKLLKGLDLSDAQREQVREAMASKRPNREAAKQRHQAMQKRIDALLTAFATDDFNAAQTMGDFEPPLADMVSRKVEMLRALLPILDDAQRAKLADRLEQGHHGHREGWH